MKWKFFNIGRANAEIARLNTALGIENEGYKFLNIARANEEIRRLEGLLKKQAGQVAPAGATAGAPVTPTAPVLPTLSRSQCRAVFTDVFREGVALGLTDAELLEDTLTRIQAERLTLPGGSKADCSGLDTRAKMFRGQKQDRLDHVLKTVK
jgi:hypothetical protein